MYITTDSITAYLLQAKIDVVTYINNFLDSVLPNYSWLIVLAVSVTLGYYFNSKLQQKNIAYFIIFSALIYCTFGYLGVN